MSHHDWHSDEYVSDWIERDVARDGDRRPQLQGMLAAANLDAEAQLRVLDVGAGYGVVSAEVLQAFPNANVTLHDFSDAMLEHARGRLSRFVGRTTVARGDLSTPAWTAELGDKFDLVVSSLVIHNLNGISRIPGIYAEILSVLEPGGVFLNYDIVSFTGGHDQHEAWLRGAGYRSVEVRHVETGRAVMVARRAE